MDVVRLVDNVDLWVADDSAGLDLNENASRVAGCHIFGPAYLCRQSKGESVSLLVSDITRFEQADTAKTATFVRRMPRPSGWSGAEEMRLYRTNTGEHLIVSAVVAFDTGPETYIFAADASGEITSWHELSGSFKGALDHERALRGAGYTVMSE